MKIATFNINDVNRRLPNLMAWLAAAKPDVVCLQELKTEDRQFPQSALQDAGYGAVWHGQRTWNGVAILARGAAPVLTRRGLPGDPADTQARYIEAAVGGVLIGCIYLPNGNPQPGPKFDYKLAWFERLIERAAVLFTTDAPVILAGDYNVVPTDFDIYPTKSYAKNALVQPEPRACYRRLLNQGWTDALRTQHPDAPMFTFWDYLRQRWPRDAGLRLDHLLLNRPAAERLTAANVDKEVRGKEGASDHAPAWVTLRRGRVGNVRNEARICWSRWSKQSRCCLDRGYARSDTDTVPQLYDHLGRRPDGHRILTTPDRPIACYVMAHGAGAGMTHPFMAAAAEGLAGRRIATLRYQFPYMEHGSNQPDPPKLAHATVRAAVSRD